MSKNTQYKGMKVLDKITVTPKTSR